MHEAARKVRLFWNNRNQAVRIPRDFEFDGDEVMLRKEGERLVIEPAPTTTLVEFLETAKPLDLDFPEIDDPLPDEINI